MALALGKSLKQIGMLTPAELESWRQFYSLYPFDDYHRYFRPAALIASAGSKGPETIKNQLAWLQPEPVVGDFSDSDVRTLAALGVTPPRG